MKYRDDKGNIYNSVWEAVYEYKCQCLCCEGYCKLKPWQCKEKYVKEHEEEIAKIMGLKKVNRKEGKNYDTYLFIGIDTKSGDADIEFYGDESDLIANIGALICYAVEEEGVSVDKILEVYYMSKLEDEMNGK